MENLEIGDYVRDANGLNGGLQMSVEDMRINANGETEVLLSHFEDQWIHKTDWYNINRLILNKKAEGGFI
jgi:hypothetical protein